MKTLTLLTIGFGLNLFGSFVQAEAWTKKSVWKDRRAEVAVYDSELLMSSMTYKFRETLIISKENVLFAKGKPVPAFRLNQVGGFQYDNFPVNYLNSLF